MRQRVPGRSKDGIRNIANIVRQECGVWDATYINIVYFLENVLSRFFPNFVLEIVENQELGDVEAITYPNEMRMVVRESTYNEACSNNGHSRFTLAHETGHLFLHRNIPAAYTRSASGEIRKYEDSEWQADVFAGHFLAPIHQIGGKSVDRVIDEYKISRPAAKIQLDIASKELIKRKPLV